MNIAIVGCGQLARLLAQAAGDLGVDCAFVAVAGESTTCVDGLGPVVAWSPGDDTTALYRALGEPGLVTVEREAVDVGLLRELQSHCDVAPSPECVLVGQNRKRERELLQALKIPCAPYRLASNPAQVRAAVSALGLPLVVKATESGYDGKLQWRLHTGEDVERFCQACDGEYLLEEWVPFDREVSIVAARSSAGEFLTYPLAENTHRDGILLCSVAPARDMGGQHEAAAAHAKAIMEKLDYVGVMAIEFFDVAGVLWVNEIAPRVHNSGHWTMLEDLASQFENHLRGVLGMPLGGTTLHRHAGMINILGSAPALVLAGPLPSTARLHLYNKSPAPLRKLGHLNLVARSEDELRSGLGHLHEVLYAKDCTGQPFLTESSREQSAGGSCHPGQGSLALINS